MERRKMGDYCRRAFSPGGQNKKRGVSIPRHCNCSHYFVSRLIVVIISGIVMTKALSTPGMNSLESAAAYHGRSGEDFSIGIKICPMYELMIPKIILKTFV